MPAAKKPLIIEQRATFARRLRWTDLKGRPINLTGCTVRMQIRPVAGSPELLFELSTANGRISITPTLGIIDLKINANDTDSMTFANAVYDLKVEFPGANAREFRLMEGTIRVAPGVTV